MRSIVIISMMAGALVLQSCTSIKQKVTGVVVADFTEKNVLPQMYLHDDARWICEHTQSIAPLFESLLNGSTRKNNLLPLSYLTSGLCIELNAMEHKVNAIQASKIGFATKVKDERILEKRKYAKASQRYWKGYQAIERAYPVFYEQRANKPNSVAKCPSMTQNEELYWLIAQISGAQAIISDVASGSVYGYPTRTLAKIAENVQCIDNDAWWGAPNALSSAIWLSLPALKPSSINALEMLNESVAKGSKQGVRLAAVLKAQFHLSKGQTEDAKKTIKAAFQSRKKVAPMEKYRLFDEVAFEYLLLYSDKLWVEDTGSRTPMMKMGDFYSDKKEVNYGFDDLL